MNKKKGTQRPPTIVEIEQAILEDEARVREGVDHCLQHRGGGRWPEWEERVLELIQRTPSLGGVCLRYVCEVVRGRWLELEDRLFGCLSLQKYLLEYLMSGVIGLPCKSLERRILNSSNSSAIVYVYARWVRGTPWQLGEKAILRDLKNETHSLLWWDMLGEAPTEVCATEYALHLRNGHWPALEQNIYKGQCTPWVAVDYAEKVRRQPMPAVEANMLGTPPRSNKELGHLIGAITHYVKVFPGRNTNLRSLILAGHCDPALAVQLLPVLGQNGRWEQFETTLLSMPASEHLNTAIIEYTARFVSCRWEKAEEFLLAQRKDDRFRRAVLLYAGMVIHGRWAEAEGYLEKSSSNVLLEYADAIASRLPDALHNSMVMKSFATPDDRWVRQYTDEYGT